MSDPAVPELPPPPPPSWADRLRGWRPPLPLPMPGAAVAAAVAAAMAAVVIAVVVGALLLTRRGSPPPLSLPRAAGVPAEAGGAGQPAPADQPPDGQAGAGATVTVHAAGAVARPGIYVLPGKARVADALAAAGGTVAEADVDQLNLAAKLTDAQRVYVPRRGEVPPPEAAAGAAPAVTAEPGTPAQPLDLNAATAAELDVLPGVGPATAQAIVAHRSANGRFRSVSDLLSVRGIGPAKLEAIRPLVRVGAA